MITNPGTAPRGYSRHDVAVLSIVCAAVFMATLDMFVVSVALHRIGLGFPGAQLSELSWILNGYTIVYAAALVPAGRLGDRIGPVSAFRAGVILFTAASLACALADALWMLIALRALQALGAALATPSGYALLMTALPAATKQRSVRIWASVGAMSGVAGPVVGGALVDISWRLIFLINVPIGIATIIAAFMLLRPGPRHASHEALPDLLGAALLIAAIAAGTLALVEGPNWGWTNGFTLAAAATCVAAAALFILRTTRASNPLVDLDLLTEPVFARTTVVILLTSIVFALELLSVVLFMQRVWGWSGTMAGLAIAPGPLMVPIVSLMCERLKGRVSPRQFLLVGAALFCAGALVFLSSAGPEPNYFGALLPGWLMVGAGAGFAFPTAIAVATQRLPAGTVSTGSAIVTMVRQFGTVLGTALVVVALAIGGAHTEEAGRFLNAWWLAAGLGGVAALIALTIPSAKPVRPATETP